MHTKDRRAGKVAVLGISKGPPICEKDALSFLVIEARHRGIVCWGEVETELEKRRNSRIFNRAPKSALEPESLGLEPA